MLIALNKIIKVNQRFLLALLILCISCNEESISKKENNGKPNIIYVLADDLGYGDVQYYNKDGKIPTPNINSMANNGVVFTDAHTSSAVCTPTRYGILTGRYNWRSSLKSGVLNGYSKALIKQKRTTVASMLKEKGYSTAFIGKWHLGWDWNFKKEDNSSTSTNKLVEIDFNSPINNGPSTIGFDYSFGFSGSLDMPPYVWVENDFPTQIPTKNTQSVDYKGFWRDGLTSEDFDHGNVLQTITDKAVSYINKHSKEEKPFFLYLPLSAPHTPILPNSEFLGKSKTNIYGDFVMQVDDVLNQIRRALKHNKLTNNTLLVFASDNGCSPRADYKELAQVKHNPSHIYRGAKADIFEGGHRVPFIIEWPAKAKKGTISNVICSTDFFATCAAIVNYEIKDYEAEDSFNMLPLIIGESLDDIRKYTVHHSINGSFAIRNGDWKLIFAPGSAGWSYPRPVDIQKENLNLPAMQLYNLKNDISETKNVIDIYPEKVNELKKAFIKIILDGRSTVGIRQHNEGMDNWKQIENILNI